MYKLMQRAIVYVAVTVLTFAVGVSVSVNLRSSSRQVCSIPNSKIHSEEPLSRLTNEIVSRSLQRHSFRSDKLRRNSDDEIVWRWLRESIAAYPQNWVRLNISDAESYGVVLDPIKALEQREIIYYNRQLKAKGLPILDPAKRYLPIHVYAGNIICPSWAGLIDVEEARLVFFEGSSA